MWAGRRSLFASNFLGSANFGLAKNFGEKSRKPAKVKTAGRKPPSSRIGSGVGRTRVPVGSRMINMSVYDGPCVRCNLQRAGTLVPSDQYRVHALQLNLQLILVSRTDKEIRNRGDWATGTRESEERHIFCVSERGRGHRLVHECGRNG